MRLYHGSNVAIEIIDLSRSKVGKDFGKGFYLSPVLEQAMEMARRKAIQTKEGSAIVTTFEFNMDLAKGLKVKTFDDYTEEWADFILLNRNNNTHQAVHDYDIVIGPIANDRVGMQIRWYTMGIIDKERFLRELKYMKGITYQYFFGTERAIALLKKVVDE